MQIRHRRTAAVLASAAASATVLAGCGPSAADGGWDGGGAPESLVIGAVPAEEATGLKNSYEPLIAMLEDETGLEVEFQTATDYAAVIEGQRSGQIDIAQYGPFSYYLADQSGSDITVAGAMVQEKGEEPGYTSYGIVPSGSDIESIDDFAGKHLCFVDPNSTSGYLYPLAGLLDAGIEEGDWEETFAGGHDSSAIAVAEGECDAGFAFDSMVDETLVENGSIEEGDLEVVWESETITSSPITVSNGLEPELFDTVVSAIAEKGNQDYLVENGYCEEGDCDLTDERIWGWTSVPDDFYAPLDEICATTEAEQCSSADA
ncbi:phosphate/phosphite/phosphonate ABC transporter substrate-binding protein [Nocardiopsis sp. RSe5-2]|uniref:Phosphate/phosphite/phosphonate ABC transporter substrate-binding protein n=1 Tax=Nocardiopsis endophytica TaxID=3018445 RepID=A0ABT4U7F0_9ACTN|nr:phosphate/phosphite/phosphonate ABC transporter substrate-binding protein [Nocardiopsis endophytica]MDA2812876.1 phosphate/phosphite/phosphonate ABC transporter substrate-binding protein [Nocardiopsis endophytica]